MAKDSQINIALESDQKKKWKKHASNNDEYRDLTNLVEQAVEKQIRIDTGDEYSVEQDIQMVLSEMNELRNKIEGIEDLAEKIENTKSSKLDIEEAVERLETKINSTED